jgi:hypothetical protein
MALICLLYGERDCTKFLEAWMPLAYTVPISNNNFNWGAMILKKLSTNILQSKTPKYGETSSFHMMSHLMDVIYTRNIFADMNLRWNVLELPVHVYLSILWENRYNRSYALICDEFIAHIYFIVFKKECPMLTEVAKKMIPR